MQNFGLPILAYTFSINGNVYIIIYKYIYNFIIYNFKYFFYCNLSKNFKIDYMEYIRFYSLGVYNVLSAFGVPLIECLVSSFPTNFWLHFSPNQTRSRRTAHVHFFFRGPSLPKNEGAVYTGIAGLCKHFFTAGDLLTPT